MKLKTLLTITLFLLFFLGEIAITFSFKQESKRNYIEPGSIPLSHKLSNSLNTSGEMSVFDSVMNDFLTRNEIVGASVAIAKEGRLVYSKGFGLSDRELNDSVGPENLFRIASVSKLITAVAIMKLVEDDKLSINQKVFGPDGILNDSIYLRYEDKRYEDITVHHLLNHTAGWNGKKGDPVFNSLYVARLMNVDPPATMPVIIEYALSKKLDYDPGKVYSYSNLGYCILGEIIKRVTGMGYEEYVQFAILHPLGIYDMHIGKSFFDERYQNEVKYYDLSGDMLVWSYDGSHDLVPPEYGGNNMELLGAAGGWIASAPELAKLMVAIDGFDSRPDILSKKTIEYMTNVKRKRKGVPSPCIKNMRCHDCIGPHRACAVTSIIESGPPHTKIHVIIVNEDLGLGWDKSWPEERINRIIKRHEEHMVMCPMPECIFEKGNNEKLWEMARQKKRGVVWP